MTTTHWRSNEASLARTSFNALVERKQFDVPEEFWKHNMMGRQAVMGPEYVPNGIFARHQAGTLKPTRAASLTMLKPNVRGNPLPGSGTMRRLNDSLTGSFRRSATSTLKEGWPDFRQDQEFARPPSTGRSGMESALSTSRSASALPMTLDSRRTSMD
mmetsp:Transcript_80499/g.239907  ORF Transcript_80499/g.239907 Transcript_80499/m.239907 type:complete len:158 (-) Transcript_80499:61-534(-)|eukprot:CAMPEP_0175278834 /NCGR_PEP_ID=MMETSP0093-20121207/49728_1 /TAXON_ID=311494 /ORGANISM="Alexandrium monilatum, Strain CCMP3105" /LENGTH=157 /DNA_ID=CAMNT_0016573833 /DNA_START=87 /DNA_END=560 /DNA_ORIENTATION=+